MIKTLPYLTEKTNDVFPPLHPLYSPGHEGSDWCQQISSDKQGGRRAAAKMPGFGIPFITRTMAGNSPHHSHCVQPFL